METKPTLDIHLLPPGFRFHPSDEELIVYYLKKKVTSKPLPASIVADLDLYKYNPWDLPKKASFGEEEWYFFTPRDRKYPNGARPNRTAPSGYWKATGTDKQILTSCGTTSIGVKKALVFYKGRPPKGIKTDWVMHEYRLLDSMSFNPKKKASMRLDDWVLCRVRQKCSFLKRIWEDRNDPSYNEPAPAGWFTKVNDHNIEMVQNSLYDDCPMLPYIFASQNFSCGYKASNISFQTSDKSLASVLHEGNSVDKNNLQFSFTSFNNLFNNPLKRKQKSCIDIPPSKIIKRDTDEEEDAAIITIRENGRKQSDDTGICCPVQWNSLMQYQELDHDHLAFKRGGYSNKENDLHT